jgi:hypothetical protein
MDNVEALELVRPEFNVHEKLVKREASGHGEQLSEPDLYPDARPALSALRDQGLWVGIAGNQKARVGELLADHATDLRASFARPHGVSFQVLALILWSSDGV